MSAEEKLRQLEYRRSQLELGGGIKHIEKQHQKGKQTARERLLKLLDKGSFKEIDLFVQHRSNESGMQGKETVGDGVVCGYGTIEGRLVYVYAQDFTVMGGSLGEMHAAKICKVQDMALKMGAPLIGINDSGGARIQEGVDALSGYGKIFFRNTIASGVIPQISIIMGPCAGGAVYSPALTDFVFMVHKTSKMFITGPEVIKTVTEEVVSPEELGGARTHSKKSGVSHFFSRTEDECFAQLKKLISYLPENNLESPPEQKSDDDSNRLSPKLDTFISDSPKKAYDMKEIIREVVDYGDFLEVLPHFAQNIVTLFARLNGKTVGIVANQPYILAGCLDINTSDKGARFIRFCDAFNIPIITFMDIPGFLPGLNQEFGGIIRHGAKMLYSYSEATVPKITVIVRKGYGGGYIAMCSKELGADQVFAWPSAEIAVMGPEGAASIIYRHEIETSEDPENTLQQKINEYRKEFANPYKAGVRGYLDDIIAPSETRPMLISTLDMLSSKRERRPAKKHGNIPL